MRIVEARAWIKKYLIAASERKGQSLVVIRGMKESRFNSSPNQAPNQEVEEIDNTVPVSKVEKNNK